MAEYLIEAVIHVACETPVVGMGITMPVSGAPTTLGQITRVTPILSDAEKLAKVEEWAEAATVIDEANVADLLAIIRGETT